MSITQMIYPKRQTVAHIKESMAKSQNEAISAVFVVILNFKHMTKCLTNI